MSNQDSGPDYRSEMSVDGWYFHVPGLFVLFFCAVFSGVCVSSALLALARGQLGGFLFFGAGAAAGLWHMYAERAGNMRIYGPRVVYASDITAAVVGVIWTWWILHLLLN